MQCPACHGENRDSAKFCNEFGTAKGKVKVPPEFFEPLPEEILRAFEG